MATSTTSRVTALSPVLRRCALELMLERAPHAGEADLEHIIRAGRLTLAVSAADRDGAPPEAVAGRLEGRLLGAGNGALVAGDTGLVHIQSWLDRTHALAAYDAVRGRPSPLQVELVRRPHSAGGDMVAFEIRASWARLHAYLSDAGGHFDEPALAAVLRRAVQAGILRVSGPVTAVRLQRVAAPLLDADGRLRPATPPGHLLVRGQAPAEVVRDEVRVGLGELIVRAGGQPPDLQLLVASGGQPRATKRLARAPARSEPLSLVATDAGVESLVLRVAPDRVGWLSGHRLGELHGAELLSMHNGAPPTDLPLVEDLTADVLLSIDGAMRWHVPRLQLVVPAPWDDPATSAFRFLLVRDGTAQGPNGPMPGLRAEIRITARLVAPPGAEATSRVGLGAPQVLLQVPFRESGVPGTRWQSFAADVALDGDLVTATVGVLDDWARLTYGALSTPAFQDAAPRLMMSYFHDAVVPLPPNAQVDFGGKLQEVIPVGTEPEPVIPDSLRLNPAGMLHAAIPEEGLGPDPTLDVPHWNVVHQQLTVGADVVQFARRAATRSLAAPKLVSARRVPVVRAAANSGMALMSNTIAIHPPLIARLRPKPDAVAVQSIVRETQAEVMLPCSELGGLYIQVNDDGERAIGCQEPLRLGEITTRLYQELSELRDPACRVLRSLRQPGRFLLVPAAYRVARYGADEPADRRFKPAMVLHATIGDQPHQNRAHLVCTLEADIPVHVRRRLEAAVAPLSPHGVDPVLELPTDIAVNPIPSLTWTVPDAIEAPSAQVVGCFVQVTISVPFDQAGLLRTLVERGGLRGRVAFALSDGTTLESELRVDTTPVGPWETGPLPARLEGDDVVVRNPLGRPARIAELQVAPDVRVPVDVVVTPGGEHRINVPGARDPVAIPAPHEHTYSLAELDVLIEEIHANVIVIDLLDHATHGLTGLTITVRLRDTTHCWVADLEESATARIDLQLGLLTYLENQILELQFTKHTSGGATTTPWRLWDLTAQGNVISVTADLLT